MARRTLRWALFILTLALVGCDHVTKLAAESSLSGGRAVDIVPGLLDLRYARNHDAAFSLTRDIGAPGKTAALVVLAAFGTLMMAVVWWRRRRDASRLEHVGYSLIVAGAVGNVADRIARGYVVDFIHLHRWPVFNVADVLIVVGAGALAVALRGARRRDVLGSPS
jgi:signal peptidase II